MGASSAQFGPFTLLYPLGAGGMGEVYLASHTGEHDIRRMVALKRMLRHLGRDEKLVRLFLDEVRIAAQLTHGNIVQVMDHGEIDGRYFMAMEYVHGENLLQVLRRLEQLGKRAPADLLLFVASCVCQGLSYAHSKTGLDGRPLGIVHRDVTPHNVLISFRGEVKVADFGVARATEQNHETLGGELKGKIAYMSPEQARGRKIDARADLYSLGVALYEVLAGENPLRRDNSLATLDAVREPEIPNLGEARPDLPPEFVEQIHWALQPDPEQRPDSARVLYEAFTQTARLHNLAVSPFDLADFMGHLFPEAEQQENGQEEGTSVGRRADGTALGRRADGVAVEDKTQRTIHYLRRRHPDARRGYGTTPISPLSEMETVLETDAQRGEEQTGDTTLDAELPRSRGPLWLFVLLATAAMAGIGWALWDGWSSVNHDQANARGIRPADSGAPEQKKLNHDAQLPTTNRATVDSAQHPGKPRRRRGNGKLSVNSQPAGATVELDGEPRPGGTPLTVELRPGRHKVSVALAGYKPWRETVVAKPGRTVTLNARLEARLSSLSVSSTHPCRVRAGAIVLGTTPVSNKTLTPGRIAISCRNPQSGIQARRTVTLKAGQSQTVAFRFGALAVNVDPWAEVTVDGRRRGTTPLHLVLDQGEHRLLLKNAEQGKNKALTVEIQAGKTKRVSSW